MTALDLPLPSADRQVFAEFDIAPADLTYLQSVEEVLTQEIQEWIVAQWRAEVETLPWFEQLGLPAAAVNALFATLAGFLRRLLSGDRVAEMYGEVEAATLVALRHGVRNTDVFQASTKLESVLTGVTLQLFPGSDQQTVALVTLAKFLKSLLYVVMETYRRAAADEIERRNRDLSEALEQQRRLFDEIQDKSRQLAEASQHKSQFLANMSHELRTPLNAIIGVSEMLREDAEALKQDTEPIDRVLGAGRHLLALINDILDLSKIEAGRMELHLESFPLVPLVQDVVKTIEPLAAKNANQVAVHCDAAIGTLYADQMRLRQALLNLLSNANKFTDRGTITIDASQRQENGRDWITLAVTDTGIGMTAEQMGNLFQEFSQASSTTASKYGGTGLGLAISRRFCQMMGGDITVESKPDRGSTFTIRLPRIVEAPKEAVPANPTHTAEVALKRH